MKTDEWSSSGACDDSYGWKRTKSDGDEIRMKDVEEKQGTIGCSTRVRARPEGCQSRRGCRELNCPLPLLAWEKNKNQQNIDRYTGGRGLRELCTLSAGDGESAIPRTSTTPRPHNNNGIHWIA